MLSSPPRAGKDAAASASTSSGLQAPAGADDVQASAGAGEVQRFGRLKIPELKRVCAATQLLVSGSKPQLIERVLGCKTHGRLGSVCSYCKHSKLELIYAPDSHGELHAVKCKHMTLTSWQN